MTSTESATDFFRVAPDSDDTCPTCKKGSLVTVVYTDEDGEEVGIGISRDADGDGPESAEAHAHELNWAFELGVKHATSRPVPSGGER